MKRLYFDFSDKAFESLEELKKVTEAPTLAEVVRRALDTYYQDTITKQQPITSSYTYAGEIN